MDGDRLISVHCDWANVIFRGIREQPHIMRFGAFKSLEVVGRKRGPCYHSKQMSTYFRIIYIEMCCQRKSDTLQ